MAIEKVEKLVANLHDKTEYVIHITNLKQALNHKLFLKKLHRVIKFNQNPRLKPYTDMSTDLKKSKKWVWNFYAAFGKTVENVRKDRDIKLVTTERRKNY